MRTSNDRCFSLFHCGFARWMVALFIMLCGLCSVSSQSHAQAVPSTLNVSVTEPDGTPVSGFRWLLEEDNTLQTPPQQTIYPSIGTIIHNSHAPVVAKGETSGASTTVAIPDSSKRYMLSILPYDASLATVAAGGHSIGGANIAVNQTQAKVIVNKLPLPTAQISVLAFNDNYPINNAPDTPAELGIAGCRVMISDMLGEVTVDAFGNRLGTTYDSFGNVLSEGDGIILTGADGIAIIKYLPPGKYGVQVVPPAGQGWIQTATIEGTPTVDAWVKANEPEVFVEGFGTGFQHVFIGFVKPDSLPWAGAAPGGHMVTGQVVFNHFSAPPFLQGFHVGPPVGEAFVGLNDPVTGEGLYAAPCNADGTFTITGVPDGTYELVTWDIPLLTLFGFHTLTVSGADVALGPVLTFAWFGNLKGHVFNDANENGFFDPSEHTGMNYGGIDGQAVNLRFRDGSIYQSLATDPSGNYDFEEVFPFFKFLVVEVDFARFKATGMTTAIDAGGDIPTPSLPPSEWITPSFGKLNPQLQETSNPNTGNNLSRTEVSTGTDGVYAPVLTQAMQLFLGQTNVIDWGKTAYPVGQNGGISGIVFFEVSRAQDDPRQAVGDPWEPGVPRVQVNLYQDSDGNGVIDDLDGDGGPTLADRDNYPLGNFPGVEDLDTGTAGAFDYGDAIQVAWTDSFDDDPPSGCINRDIYIDGILIEKCFDNFGCWNQVRPGLFDGGYAFNSYFPGGMASGSEEVQGLPADVYYIVEAATPDGYDIRKEEDKNVDFGDRYKPSPLADPPACVGDPHVVPPYLSFQTFSGDGTNLLPGYTSATAFPSPYAGSTRPLCDRKQILLADRQNGAVDFFVFTQVPKAARAVGFVNNDLSPEFDPNSPIYGEKSSPKWIPVSFQDWAGNEVARVYTDEYGAYNALLPSTYTNNLATPAGLGSQMLTLYLNHPWITNPETGERTQDPNYDPNYSQMGWTFNYEPGKTSYLDTPIVPVASFVGYPDFPVDVEPASGTPVVSSVVGPVGGPYVSAAGQTITIKSVGNKAVPNPAASSLNSEPKTIDRDFGFGVTTGSVTVNGVPLQINPGGWTNDAVTAVVPAGVTTGQLVVTRGDNGNASEMAVTLHVGWSGDVLHVGANKPYKTIQAAVDDANSGSLILVDPGFYDEAVIVYKNVTLQGSGAVETQVYAYPAPFEKLTAWHNKIQSLVDTGQIPDPGVITAVEAPGFFVLVNDGVFSNAAFGRIDGFNIYGSIAGGGIYVWDFAHYLKISNNMINGNQGSNGGGITIGKPDIVSANDHISVQNNKIVKNGGVLSGGGVTVYTGSDYYKVTDNRIAGNFSRGMGGGICHLGLSPNGLIARNLILFNEVFYGAPIGGEGGGIYVGGVAAANVLSEGTGSVTINGNLIHGNLAGSSHGGGIRAASINGLDVQASPADDTSWYSLKILNNVIVNNVSAYTGGGVSLQDAAKVSIINNTIAHNDSVATAAAAFPAGTPADPTPVSNAQAGGVSAGAHSTTLAVVSGQTFANPILTRNIIWQNRSFRFNPALNGGAGGLQANADPYWDLQVFGTVAAEQLSPEYCVLTDTTGYSPTNSAVNPNFALPYYNNLLVSTVLDEGGNAISARYNPLTAAAGNYYLHTPATPPGAFVQPWYLDMDGDGIFDGSLFKDRVFFYGVPSDLPVVGDWNGDGERTVGVYRGGAFFLRYSNSSGNADLAFNYGMPGDTPINGDWLGNGVETVAIVRNAVFHLKYENTTGGADLSFAYGMPSDTPIVGDWDGDGIDTIGVRRGNTFYLRNSNSGGTADVAFAYGLSTDVPIVGDWDGDGIDTIGVYRPTDGQFYVRNSNATGFADLVLNFGILNAVPLAGNW